MNTSLIIALASVLCCSSPAFAQVGLDDSMPSVETTSPLGINATTPVGGTGIGLGSTEIPSAGVSPLPTYSTGTIALPGSGTTCPTLVTSPSEMMGSTDTYDGGGLTMGSTTIASAATMGTMGMSATTASAGTAGTSAGTPPTSSTMSTDQGLLPISGMTTASATGSIGLSGMCGFGSGSMAASSSSPTAPTTPGGNPRTGIPLDSWEIPNLGVSSAAAIPTPTVLPGVAVGNSVLPQIPTVAAPLLSSTTTTNCSTTGTGLSTQPLSPTQQAALETAQITGTCANGIMQ